MFNPSAAVVFPLPLTTFEKYMLWDDRLEYPMVFAFQMNLSGDLRRSVFESAINEALTHHPLLCANVKKNSQKNPVWVPADALRPIVDWNVLGVPINSSNNDGIDLEREVGLRVWVRQGDGRAELTMQFHHACCDGIGVCDLSAMF